ncbi:MAG: TIR-like protein FxsC [Gammaproteobacteria bacterium]
MLHFFLSCASGDADIYVQKFYEDLCDQIRLRAGLNIDQEVGFLYTQSIQLGDPWPQSLCEALSTSSCFLALCSPRYFLSEFCGKEWRFFSERLDEYENRTKIRAPAILPVKWLPVSSMHPAAEAIQYSDPRLGVDYNEHGLWELIKLERHHDNYWKFVIELAKGIVETAKRHPIPQPGSAIRIADLRSMFLVDEAAQGLVELTETPEMRSIDEQVGDGEPSSRYVHFVVVAGGRDEMMVFRSQLQFYGDDGQGWAPYWPTLPDPLGVYASRLAAERRFDSEVAGIDGLSERIDAANRNNQIVILLIDMWAIRLDHHRAALENYDERDEPTIAAMIPFNNEDSETQRRFAVLGLALANVLHRNMIRVSDPMFRYCPTPDSFGADLTEILEIAQNRIFIRGTVYSSPSTRPVQRRPFLEGPSVDGAS